MTPQEEAAWERGVTRLGELSSQLAQIHAAMVEETAILLATDGWAGGGVRSPQHFLQVFGWVSPSHSRQLVDVAKRRTEIPETMDLMAKGRVSLDQAAVVARHLPTEFSAAGAELAEKMTVLQLRRALSRYAFQISDEVDPDLPVPPAPESELRISSSGSRFTMVYETTPDEGALVEQAIREAKDALFAAGTTDATLADGLLEVARRSLQAVETPSRRDHYRVLIHLDVDGHGWIGTQGALPPEVLRKITCDGQITPVWEKDSSPVAVGRSMRIVPGRTRKLIEDRDRGCRYPGCPVTRFLENHHMRHWSDGGATDPDNLVSLCPQHHTQHHNGEFTISGDPTTFTGLTFTSRRGWVIQAIRPSPPPMPPPPTPANTEILRGDTCDTQWLEIPPNAPPATLPPDPEPSTSDPPDTTAA